MNFHRLFLFLFLFCGLSHLYALDSYEVRFNGVADSTTLQLLRSSSQLIELQKNPPATAAALRRRAEADIPRFNKVLQSQSYYDAKVDLHINLDVDPVEVIFEIQTGPRFPLVTFNVAAVEGSSPLCEYIPLCDLNIELNVPALPKNIIKAEELLLGEMAVYGFPLASIVSRKVEVDITAQTVSVFLEVNSGPQAIFGRTEVVGACSVDRRFFNKKIAWHYGERYNPCRIDHTLRALEASALFSSINIRHAEAVEEGNYLPMTIEVVEGKHQSVGFGLGYSTMRSFGVVAECEHRNMRNLGERLSIRSSVWNNYYDIACFYLIPDWIRPEQDLIYLVEAKREETRSFTETSLTTSVTVERQLCENIRTTIGAMFKELELTDSPQDGHFNLVKVPLSFKWYWVDDITDAKEGMAFYWKSVPTQEILNRRHTYWINNTTTSFYLPFDKCKSIVFATKLNIGTIIGQNLRGIPLSERFYAGSEETLRGYRYLTVSPFKKYTETPIGGCSMAIVNLELRWRLDETWGSVIFYDVGNVYADALPQIWDKQLQSLGGGIRYHTPVGPLRLDVAFPLNKRIIIDEHGKKHGMDRAFQIYLSLGQTF